MWIGHGVTILSGITIGYGAVIAANSTVVKDVAPYEIVGGNPARAIRKRFTNEVVELLLKLMWWDLPIESIKEICKELSSIPDSNLIHSLISRYRV